MTAEDLLESLKYSSLTSCGSLFVTVSVSLTVAWGDGGEVTCVGPEGWSGPDNRPLNSLWDVKIGWAPTSLT